VTDSLKTQIAIDGNADGFVSETERAKQAGKDMAQALAQSGEQAGGAFARAGDGAGAAAEKVDKGARSMVSSIQRVTAEYQAGEKGTRAYYEALAAQRGISVEALKPYLDQLDAAKRGQDAASISMVQYGKTAKETAGAVRGIAPQITDIVTSLQAGQAPLTVFLQQGGQLKDMFGGVIPAAKALGSAVLGMITPLTVVGGAIAAIAVAYAKGAGESKDFQRAIVDTGNASGITADQLLGMTARMAEFGVSQHAAAAALTEFVKAGVRGADTLQQFATSALRLEQVGGQSVEKTAKAFADLADKPLEAMMKLNQALNFVNPGLYEQVKALEAIGRTSDAAKVAAEAYGGAIQNQTAGIANNLGTIERAWLAVKTGALAALDAAFGVGRPSSDPVGVALAKVAQTQAQLDRAKSGEFGSGLLGQGATAYYQSGLDAAKELLGYVQAEAKGRADAAKAGADQVATMKLTVDYEKLISESLPKEYELQQKINRLRADGVALGRDYYDIEAAVARLREKSAPKERRGPSDAQKEAAAQAKLMAELSGLTASFAEDWNRLLTIWKAGRLNLDSLLAAQKALLDKQPAIRANAEAEKKVAEASAAAMKKFYNEASHANVAYEKHIESIEKEADAAEKEAQAVGLTKAQLDALTASRLDSIIAMKEQTRVAATLAGENSDETEKIAREISALRRQKAALLDKSNREDLAAEKAAAQKTYDDINGIIVDAFSSAFSDSKNAFTHLMDGLKRIAEQYILKPVIQAVVSPVTGNLMSMVGMSGNSGTSSLGGLLGGGNWYSSGYNGGMFSGGMGPPDSSGAYSQTYGQVAGEYLGAGVAGYGIGTVAHDLVGNNRNQKGMEAGAVAGAIVGTAIAPGIGTIIGALIGALAGSLIKAGGGQKLGGSAGFQSFYPGETDTAGNSSAAKIVKATGLSYSQLLKALGGAGSAEFAFGYDTDPKGTAGSRISSASRVNGKVVYSASDIDVGREQDALKAAIALEAKRATLAALQSSDLPKQIAEVFSKAVPASMDSDAIDTLLAFGSAMERVIAATTGNVAADAMTAWADAQKTSVDKLRDMAANVVTLADAMDGSTASMEALATASETYRSAVVQVLVAITDVAKQAEAMQSSIVESITTNGMDSKQLFDFYIGKANTSALGLGTATSPEAVQAISQTVYGAIQSALGSLPSDQRTQYNDAILGFLSEFGSGVDAALNNIRDATIASTSEPFAAATTALDSAGTKFASAADSQTKSATTMADAAAALLQAANAFSGAMPVTVVVKAAGGEVNG